MTLLPQCQHWCQPACRLNQPHLEAAALHVNVSVKEITSVWMQALFTMAAILAVKQGACICSAAEEEVA